jgi:hypothetical protein
MSAVAALAEGGGGGAGAISKDAPVVTMAQLAEKMDHAPAIPISEATNIMLGLLRDQEERLDIVVDRLDFETMLTGGRSYANYQGKTPGKETKAAGGSAAPSFGKDPKAGFAKDGRTPSTTSLGGSFAAGGKRPSQSNLTSNADKAKSAEDARSGFAKSGRANSTTSLGSRALGRGRAALLGAMGKSSGEDADAPKLITAATVMSVLRGTEIKVAIKKQRLIEKKEKIDELINTCEKNKIKAGNFDGLCAFLKKELANSNINVATVAIRAAAALTKNLKKDFAAGVKALINAVLLKFKEKRAVVLVEVKSFMEAALLETNM